MMSSGGNKLNAEKMSKKEESSCSCDKEQEQQSTGGESEGINHYICTIVHILIREKGDREGGEREGRRETEREGREGRRETGRGERVDG